MRAVIGVALALALPMAGVAATFVHAHPDDHATGHHDGHAVHAHLSGHAAPHHAPDEWTLDSDDHDRAVYANAFVAVPVASFSVPAAAIGIFHLAPPAERAAHRPVHVVHGHDPPARRSLPARAPPFVLS